MRLSSLLLLIAFFSMLQMSADGIALHRITELEAAAIVESREAEKAAKHEAQLQELGAAEVVGSKVVQSSNGSLTVNAIRPLVLEKPVLDETPHSNTQLTEAEWTALVAQRNVKIPEQISMGANVYGDEYSEITWRDTETNVGFIVWTNVNLSYLRPITSIQDEEYDYMYFGFVTNYTREDEAARLEFAKEKGFSDVVSRWKTPPVQLSPDQFEYVVVVDSATAVPQKLYRQLNAVLGHYVANQEDLETAHHNSVALENARRKYLEENPPAPKQTMVNFWKIESETSAE